MQGRKKHQQSKKRDYRRERAYTLLTNSGNDRELAENIDLSIGGESDVTSEGGDDNNIEGKFRRTCRCLFNQRDLR
jgi:hypothetical protein